MADTASEVRVCHNDRCAQEYTPRRWDQKHCTMTCAHYCLICLRPKYGEKNRRAREQREGVPWRDMRHGRSTLKPGVATHRKYIEGKPA